jgi:hypothetical protein
MRCLAVLICVAATSLDAQQPVPAPAESVPADSLRPPADSPRVPATPTPEQQRFLGGLRTATRGLAQLKDGLNRVTRAQGTGDAVARRRAGRLLAGLCGSARGFLARGRPQMKPAVYEDTTRVKARQLTARLDSLITYVPTCEKGAAASTGPVATELEKRMKLYEVALNEFRGAIGLPVRTDSSQPPRRP